MAIRALPAVLLLLAAACADPPSTFAGAVKSYSFTTRVPEWGGDEDWKIQDQEVSFDIVHVPAGSQGMIPFWIGKTEVTYDSYSAFWQDPDVDETTMPTLPYEPPEYWRDDRYDTPGKYMGRGTHPALAMRRYAAERYCLWLEKKTGRRFRLPTEREWQVACRWDNEPGGTVNEIAWYGGNSEMKTHEVGTRTPNGIGLHDMLGNVWEFCLEPFEPGEFQAALRGGAFNSPAESIRPSSRLGVPKEWYHRDPNRPRSQWWLADGQVAGFRVLSLADPTPREEQKAYLSKIRFENVKILGLKDFKIRVSGTVVNTGDRTIVELEARMKGSPDDGRFFPVLVNGYHEGERRHPQGPGERRDFVDVIWCHYGGIHRGKDGAVVTAVQLAPK